jgi:hypothetical protein
MFGTALCFATPTSLFSLFEAEGTVAMGGEAL